MTKRSQATFSTVFSGGVTGGPCPVCGLRGELHAHFGTYDPDGIRTIVHFDDQTGVHECSLPFADGLLLSGPDPVWSYQEIKKERP